MLKNTINGPIHLLSIIPPFIHTAIDPDANHTPSNNNKSYMAAAILLRGNTLCEFSDILV